MAAVLKSTGSENQAMNWRKSKVAQKMGAIY